MEDTARAQKWQWQQHVILLASSKFQKGDFGRVRSPDLTFIHSSISYLKIRLPSSCTVDLIFFWNLILGLKTFWKHLYSATPSFRPKMLFSNICIIKVRLPLKIFRAQQNLEKQRVKGRAGIAAYLNIPPWINASKIENLGCRDCAK